MNYITNFGHSVLVRIWTEYRENKKPGDPNSGFLDDKTIINALNELRESDSPLDQDLHLEIKRIYGNVSILGFMRNPHESNHDVAMFCLNILREIQSRQ